MIYEFKFTADLEDKDPGGLELLLRQGMAALVPQAGGTIVEDVSVTEVKPPKAKK